MGGLLKCGVCGGGFGGVSVERLGCYTHYKKGKALCANAATVKRRAVEDLALDLVVEDLFASGRLAEIARRCNGAFAEELRTATRRLVEVLQVASDVEALVDALRAKQARQKQVEATLAGLVEPKLIEPERRRPPFDAAEARVMADDPAKRQLLHEAMAEVLKRVVVTPSDWNELVGAHDGWSV